MPQELYRFANIRELLTQGFSDQELRNLCFDVPGFRSVYEEIGANTDKTQIVAKLLDHAERTLQVDTLLALAKDLNPARYKAHQPYYLADSVSAIQKQLADLARQVSALQEQPANQARQVSALTKKTSILYAGVIAAIVGAIVIGFLIGVWFASPFGPTPAIKVTPTADNNSLSIESIPMKVYSYDGGVGDPEVGKGWSRLSVIYDENSHASYMFNYFLPDAGEGYVGLAFGFTKTQDLAEYKFIEVTINFEDDQTRSLLFITDDAGHKESISLGIGVSLDDSIVVNTNGREQTYKIPLDTSFKPINPKIVKEIEFDCDADFTRGNHTFTVKGIRFLKL